jgi:undecaprenyl-diphosphatase
LTPFQAAILGLVQGLTEFLPVSSSGHLVLIQHVFGLGGAENLTFDILLHVATLVAVVVYFRRELALLVLCVFVDRKQRRLAACLLLAMVPTVVIALAIRRYIEQAFDSPTAVGFMLLTTGGILFVSPRVRQGKAPLEGVRLRHALAVGCAQGLAALPGLSRSGATICAGILSGVASEAAARFSFLLAVPAILAAAALDIEQISALDAPQVLAAGAGMAVAFVVGLASIHWLLRVARKGRFDGFAYYCWAVGGVAVLVALLGAK